MKSRSSLITLGIIGTFAGTIALTGQGPLPRPVVWADCELFRSVVAPNALPDHGNFDQLYMLEGGTFKEGVSLISDAKPGDQDFNGGRWHVNVLKEGVDPAKYANACSVDDLDLGDWEGTGVMFNCPMLPMRGRNN